MNDLEKLQATLATAAVILAVAAVALAWLTFAEHPTAANFRRAALATLYSA